jgi:hypothetical protein
MAEKIREEIFSSSLDFCEKGRRFCVVEVLGLDSVLNDVLENKVKECEFRVNNIRLINCLYSKYTFGECTHPQKLSRKTEFCSFVKKEIDKRFPCS